MPLTIVRNDITRMAVDAIVNAANHTLLGGGGVDGAIHHTAGPELLQECRRLGGCAPGQAKITGAYRLPSRYVIHTVGPVWQGGCCGEEMLLRSCYRTSLKLAQKHGCQSVAFPLISAGAYGYPRPAALRVATEEIRAFLNENDMDVTLVIFDAKSYRLSGELFDKVSACIDDSYAESYFERPYVARRMSERCMTAPRPAPDFDRGLERALQRLDEGFSGTLLRLIDQRGMTDAECYHRANVDRKHFSKIRSNPDYRPSKETVLAFAVALRLSIGETEDLLRRAGYALSDSRRFDVAVRYFITHRHYDIDEINAALFDLDMPLLG